MNNIPFNQSKDCLENEKVVLHGLIELLPLLEQNLPSSTPWDANDQALQPTALRLVVDPVPDEPPHALGTVSAGKILSVALLKHCLDCFEKRGIATDPRGLA